jgi:nitroimidazol reductase NimA-like FMN-containing flavoprotein (pyridoxamine 5'-phosphate oxidase superfamily)
MGFGVLIHSAREGRKIDMLQKNGKVCVEIELDEIVGKQGE